MQAGIPSKSLKAEIGKSNSYSSFAEVQQVKDHQIISIKAKEVSVC
jgi:hypothetical protein